MNLKQIPPCVSVTDELQGVSHHEVEENKVKARGSLG